MNSKRESLVEITDHYSLIPSLTTLETNRVLMHIQLIIFIVIENIQPKICDQKFLKLFNEQW